VKLFTVIFKPTLECNQACGYCYVSLRKVNLKSPQQKKAISTFSLLLDNLKRIDDKNICIIFHGGEPLLMGIEFYESCALLVDEYESKYGLSIKKCVQSNLLNVPLDILSCLHEHSYEISTSLDGTELAHDYFRTDKKGAKTFKRVVKNIYRAKKMGFVINAICCVSNLNVTQPKEMYGIFESLQVNPKFNFLETEKECLPFKARISPEQYADFVLRVTEIWLDDKASRIDVLPSSDMLSALVNGYSESCIHSKDCQRNFVCVGPKGDVWPCGKCIGIDQFYLGDLFEHDNGLVSYDRRRRTFGKGNGLPAECIECEYSILCNGLCPFDTYAEHKSFNRVNRWCRAYKIIWEGMKGFITSHNLDLIGSRWVQ